MTRLFASSSSDRVVPGNALTLGSLVLHLLAVAALLVPLRHIVSDALRERPLVYLAPPDRAPQARELPGPRAADAPASVPGNPEPGRAAIEPDQTLPGQGAPASASNPQPAEPSVPREIEAAAVTELEVDSAVVRDPASAAPAYPPALLHKGISGYADVRFVVDTLGVADTLSFRIQAATHAEFGQAVRRALPDMRFRPAVQLGHRVPQWVEQRFNFRITRDSTGLAPTAPR